MGSSRDAMDRLTGFMHAAWEAPDTAPTCASQLAASFSGEQEEQELRRLLLVVDALRGPLMARLKDHDANETARKRAKCGEGKRDSVSKAEGDAQSGPSGSAVAALPEAEACVEVHGGMSHSAKAVLLDVHLLERVWDYVLGGNGRQDVRLLEHLSLVCRKWREVGAWDAWWESIKQDILPLLWEEEEGEEAASSRGRVMQYWQFLKDQRNPPSLEWGEDWAQRLEARVEIFDRMDGLQMLSMRGPVALREDELTVQMTFPSDLPAMHVETAAFSAASRDPLGRFANVADYLMRGHEEQYPCDLCMRVTLRDTQTGMMALVWEMDKSADRDVEILGADADCIQCAWVDTRPQETLLGRLVDPGHVFFNVSPVPGQAEDVGDQDRLYTIDTRPGELRFIFNEVIGSAGATLVLEEFKLALRAALVAGPRGLTSAVLQDLGGGLVW